MSNNFKHSKQHGFSTPENYFDSFDAKLLQQLKEEKALHQVKDPGFKVPDYYFNEVDGLIIKSVSKKPKVITMPLLKKTLYTTGIAASLLLAFSLFFNKNNISFDDVETTSLETYIESDFELQDFTTFTTNDDLDITSFSEVHFSEEHLENYILNNTPIEDLILE
ncbi:hypothetical protein [Mangrovimonas spongiae]|uniref:Uncharacterized protein n=1 Tax=Mangrovimonas spongiae TaxID=2494697 RepID=A0A3R9MS18_9FLAO|nr:hypothetical protein [Mangrovimonas spongiae]RSK39318.1 hypothetical protein EJA19_10350 [Mangrovimonas spongiae]